jgi:hypothetical protein
MRHKIALIAAMLLVPAIAHADGSKDQYHFFNPTPVEKMRPMSTDRPDRTESAYSLDAGHFMLESDIVAYSRNDDRVGGNRQNSKTLGFAINNYKFGLTNNSEIQFIVESYQHSTVSDQSAGTRRTNQGFGDITVRFKHNIMGNDDGKLAIALMPYAKLPTNNDDLGNDSIEGGFLLPVAYELGGGYALGFMTGFEYNKDDGDSGYHPAYLNSIVLDKAITSELTGYVELYTIRSTAPGSQWKNTLDLGMTYMVTPDLQLDAGINIGISDAADDYNPFLGVSYRY